MADPLPEFQIYPRPSAATSAPLLVKGSQTGALTPMTSIKAPEDPSDPLNKRQVMFIRVAVNGGPLADSQYPSIFLSVDNSDEQYLRVNDPNDPSAGFRAFGSGDATVEVGITVVDSNVAAGPIFLLSVVFRAQALGTTWTIRFKNNDPNDRTFVWVVSGDVDKTTKPWIHVVRNVDFGRTLLTGRDVSRDVFCLNYGPGELTVTDVAGLPSSFSRTLPSQAIPANYTLTNGTVNLVGIKYAPTKTERYDTANPATGNIVGDSTAIPNSAGHNASLSLTASAGQIEVGLLLDDSTSMDYNAKGEPIDPQHPGPPRWDGLTAGVRDFCETLKLYAGGGTISAVMFPADPASGAQAEVLREASTISDTTVNGVRDGIIGHARFGTTPMGAGLTASIGAPDDADHSPTTWGQFQVPLNTKNPDGNDPVLALNRRIVVLMSDGAANSDAAAKPADFLEKHPFAGLSVNTFSFRRIRVLPVFFGERDKNETSIGLMDQLAAGSHEHVPDADANDKLAIVRSNLVSAFKSVVKKAFDLQLLQGPSGTLTDAAPEARHSAEVTSYDRKVSFAASWVEEHAMIAQLVTPRGEVLTPASATPDSGIHFASHARGAMYTIDENYLRNDGSSPRYGTWTFVIRLNGSAPSGVNYQTDFITDSGLELKVAFDKPRYIVRDSVHTTATLTANGTPIPFGAVTLSVEAPLNARSNFLASQYATAQELAVAAGQLEAEKVLDVTSLLIKERALKNRGIVFSQSSLKKKIPLLDPRQEGAYQGEFQTTEVPGIVNFRIVAIGETADGGLFRREDTAAIPVNIQPNKDASQIHIDYAKIDDPEGRTHQAKVRAWPRDSFGNVLLIEKEHAAQRVALLTSKGSTVAGLVGNDDGSYTQEVRFVPDSEPVITLRVDGIDIIDDFEIPPIGEYTYVNEVVKFIVGREATPGANKHTDPASTLGNVLDKAPDTFVSLGGGGSIVLDVKNKLFTSAEEVTVFVRPDDVLRRYRVEVLTLGLNVDLSKVDISLQDWKEVGVANGITHTFDLGRRNVRAVRITDLSQIVFDPYRNPSATPGVSILGVGLGT